ncbi:MAG: hypothetical protein WC263_00765 [Candidatus Micrarchaeia archaeon]
MPNAPGGEDESTDEESDAARRRDFARGAKTSSGGEQERDADEEI